MRPIKLEIEGIHSFKERQVIDFEFISRNGIFGIFGKTGSGKSTILDSIILSLYGRVNRSKINSDFINTKLNQARVNLVFAFRVNNRVKKFEVERIFKKNKKRETEVEQSAQVFELTTLGKKQVAEGAFKVDAYLKELIGMGETEFSKCIALPQGEFAGFLKAKPSERINIIGNIFDLNQYGQQLWDKTVKRLDKITNETNIVISKLDMLEKTTPEDIKQLEQDLYEKRQELKLEDSKIAKMKESRKKLESNISDDRRFNVLEEKIKEYTKQQENIDLDKEYLSKCTMFDKIKDRSDRRDELLIEIERENKNLLDSKAKHEIINKKYTDKFKVYNDNIDEIEKEIEESAEKLQYLRSLKQNQTKIADYEQEKSKLELSFNDVKKSRDEVVDTISKLDEKISLKDSEIQKHNTTIEQNKDKVRLYNDLAEIRYVSKQIEVIEEFSSSIEQIIDGKNRESKQSKESIFDLLKREKELKKDITKSTEAINAFLKGNNECSYEKLRSIEKQLFLMNNVESKVKFLKTFIAEYMLENDEHIDNIKKREEEVKLVEEKISKHKAICHEIEQQIIAEQNEREGYLGQNVLSVMLEHIQIGDECPVCRTDVVQKNISPKTDLSIYDKNIISLRNNFKMAEVEKDKVLFELSNIQTRIEEEKKSIQINLKKISNLKKDIDKEFIKFVDINEQSESQFASLLEMTKNTVAKLEKLIKSEDALKERLTKLSDQRIELGTKSLIYNETAQELTEIYKQFQSIKAEKELFLVNFTGEERDIYQSMIDLQKFTKLSEEAKNEINKLSEEKRVLLDDLAKEKVKLAVLQGEFDKVNDKINNLTQTIKDFTEPIKKETYTDFNTYVNKFEEKRLAKIEKLKADKNQIETLSKEVAVLDNKLKLSAAIIAKFNSELDGIDVGLIEHMKKIGVNLASELKKYKIDEQTKDKIETKIRKYESEFELVKTEHRSLKEKLGDKKFDEVEYTSLVQKINEKTNLQNQRREKIGNLALNLENKRESIKKSESLHKELEVLTQKHKTAKELYDLLRGRALMEFVAEEYIDDITKIASQKLMMLKDGEYSLISEDKEFYIIDNLQDGHKRSVGTLSGGETFIVSLSLALAISESIIQNSQKSMDFFFLDEGFGTLDPELREAIISSLQRLESQNLTIGLISHVSELKNTIKSKVLVTKNPQTASSTIEYDCSL